MTLKVLTLCNIKGAENNFVSIEWYNSEAFWGSSDWQLDCHDSQEGVLNNQSIPVDFVIQRF